MTTAGWISRVFRGGSCVYGGYSGCRVIDCRKPAGCLATTPAGSEASCVDFPATRVFPRSPHPAPQRSADPQLATSPPPSQGQPIIADDGSSAFLSLSLFPFRIAHLKSLVVIRSPAEGSNPNLPLFLLIVFPSNLSLATVLRLTHYSVQPDVRDAGIVIRAYRLAVLPTHRTINCLVIINTRRGSLASLNSPARSLFSSAPKLDTDPLGSRLPLVHPSGKAGGATP